MPFTSIGGFEGFSNRINIPLFTNEGFYTKGISTWHPPKFPFDLMQKSYD